MSADASEAAGADPGPGADADGSLTFGSGEDSVAIATPTAAEEEELLPERFLAMVAQLEEKYKGRIVSLKQQLDVSERKARNAKYVADASEALAAESQLQKMEAEARAARCDALLCRLTQVGEKEKRDATMAQLKDRIVRDQHECGACEETIRDCMSDPLLHLPAGTAKRRLLARMESRVRALVASIKSETDFLQQLQEIDASFIDFTQAANAGDLGRFVQGLNSGMSINAVDETGHSIFHYACGRGHLDIVRACIEQGADLSEENGAVTPLTLAVKNGHVAVVSLLVEEGVDVNGIDEHGKTSLHLACRCGHVDVARELLNLGAEVRAIDKSGNTPLHEAARVGSVEVTELLLKNGADPADANLDSVVPLNFSQSQQNWTMISLLGGEASDSAETTPEHSGDGGELKRGELMTLNLKHGSLKDQLHKRKPKPPPAKGGRGGDKVGGLVSKRSGRASD